MPKRSKTPIAGPAQRLTSLALIPLHPRARAQRDAPGLDAADEAKPRLGGGNEKGRSTWIALSLVRRSAC